MKDKRNNKGTSFMKSVSVLVFIVILVSPGIFAGEPLVLATYDEGQITIGDLQSYVHRTGSPLGALNLSAEHFQTEKEKAQPRIEETVFDLAFFDILHRRYEKSLIYSATEEYQIHILQRNYAVQQYLYPKIRGAIRIDPNEVKRYYESAVERFRIPEQAKMSFIFMAASSDAAERTTVKERLQALMHKADFSERFEDYARLNSESPSAAQGGVVGPFAEGTYSPELESVLFSLQPRQISDIIEREKGLYVIKCLDRQEARQRDLIEAATEIRQVRSEQKFQSDLQKEIESAKTKVQFELWEKQDPPKPTDVALRVGNYSMTGEMLALEWGGLPSTVSDRFKQELNKVLEKELLFHQARLEAASDDPQLERDLATIRNEQIATDWLKREADRSITVEESAIRDYYEKNKRAYHTDTPKDIRYVLFHPRGDVSTPEKGAVALQRAMNSAEAFLQQWKDADPKERSFEKQVEDWKAKGLGAEPASLGLVTEFPVDWRVASAMIELSTGYISSPSVRTNEGFIVFYVAGEGPYRVLSYEEAHPKVESVIRYTKYQEFRQQVRESLLEEANFKQLF